MKTRTFPLKTQEKPETSQTSANSTPSVSNTGGTRKKTTKFITPRNRAKAKVNNETVSRKGTEVFTTTDEEYEERPLHTPSSPKLDFISKKREEEEGEIRKCVEIIVRMNAAIERQKNVYVRQKRLVVLYQR